MSAERIKTNTGFWHAILPFIILDKNDFFEIIKYIAKGENYNFILY
jgi:hypothetical protein